MYTSILHLTRLALDSPLGGTLVHAQWSKVQSFQFDQVRKKTRFFFGSNTDNLETCGLSVSYFLFLFLHILSCCLSCQDRRQRGGVQFEAQPLDQPLTPVQLVFIRHFLTQKISASLQEDKLRLRRREMRNFVTADFACECVTFVKINDFRLRVHVVLFQQVVLIV